MNKYNPNNRVLAVDVLRGLTLFGVIIVNTFTINGPYYLDTVDFAFQFDIFDEILSDIVEFLFLEEFYPIFVLLFGLGNQLLLNNLYTRYPSYIVSRIFIKRMFLLFLIGLLHLSLFFWGDVLLVYAVLGVCLFYTVKYFENNYQKIFLYNFCFVLLSCFINIIIYLGIANDVLHNSFDSHYYYKAVEKILPEIQELYRTGGVLNIINYNILSYYKLYLYGIVSNFDILIFLDNINYIIELYIIILFGACIANMPNWNIYINNMKSNILYKNIVILSLINLSKNYLINQGFDILEVFSIVFMLFDILLYLNIFLLLFRFLEHFKCNNLLYKISCIGKMTLTWYLLLSVLMSFVLYNYGLSLYGKIGVKYCFFISIIYYLFCYCLSSLWLSRFNQGPLEGLWRRMTISNIKKNYLVNDTINSN